MVHNLQKKGFVFKLLFFTFAFTPIIYFVTHIYPYLLIWNGYVSVEWSCVSVPVGSDAEGVERRGVEAGEGHEVDTGFVSWDGCVLEVDHAVAEAGHSDAGESRRDGAQGAVGAVVVVGKVAEEDVA